MKKIFTLFIVAGALLTTVNKAHSQCYSAVQLDGQNEYLHSPFANYTFSNFTFEMWINSSDYNLNEHYISLYQNAYLVVGGWDAGGVFNSWADGLNPISISTTSLNTPAVGTWHHVAYVYDGANQILYIDGIAVTTSPTIGTVTNSASFASGLVIGARYTQNTQFSPTSFEDVRIWNVARTTAEINANISANLTGTEPGLLAYYRFEDGPSSTTVTDLTGNGNNLTMYNMETSDWVSGPLGVIQTVDVQNTCGPLTWIDGVTYNSSTTGVTYTYVNGSVSGCDSTVTLDLTVNSPSYGTDVQVACGSFTWIDNNTYTSNNNTATYAISGGSANGCDSIVTLDLTINTVDLSVTTSGMELTSNATNAQYQWVDCDNNFASIVGENSSSFTATENGNYAVIVTASNGCSDTSACVAISSSSIEENALETSIIVSPNPSDGVFSIKSSKYFGEVNIKVIDICGKVILDSNQNIDPNTAAKIDLTEMENGMYLVKLSDAHQSHSIRVVKN